MKKVDRSKNWLLEKNPQFSSNHHKTYSKSSTHELVTLSKFHDDWTEIEDFFQGANFWICLLFFQSPSIFHKVHIKNVKLEPVLTSFIKF